MTEKTTYVAEDEKEFSTKEECIEYEKAGRVYIVIRYAGYDIIVGVYDNYADALLHVKSEPLSEYFKIKNYPLNIPHRGF